MVTGATLEMLMLTKCYMDAGDGWRDERRESNTSQNVSFYWLGKYLLVHSNCKKKKKKEFEILATIFSRNNN